MRTFKARGIVLREYEAGESDKRLVLLCKEIGRLTVYARGARKPKSKFMAAAQLFTYGDFVIADGRTFNAVNQAEVIENFYHIRTDYEKLCHAHLMLEVLEKTIMENTPCDDLLQLCLKALGYLSKPISEDGAGSVFLPPAQISCVFLFRFFLHYGVFPQTDSCAICGDAIEISDDGAYFSDEGYVCKKCAVKKPRRLRLSQAAWAGINYIASANLTGVFLFNVSPLVLDELNRAARLCWEGHFEWKLQSGEFV